MLNRLAFDCWGAGGDADFATNGAPSRGILVAGADVAVGESGAAWKSAKSSSAEKFGQYNLAD